LKTIIFRFSNAYGPYSLHKGSVVAKFIKDALFQGTLSVYGDGRQTRDFIHVSDICQLICCVVGLPSGRSAEDEGVWGNVFHLGTGIETSVLELADIMQRLFGRKLKIVHAPALKGEIRRNYSDIGKARKVLDFNPEIKIEQGVKSVYQWFMEKDIEEIKNAQVLTGSD
jgi:UDP-glucose 4-epimerase